MKIFISQKMAGLTDDDIIKRREEIKNICRKQFKQPCEFIDSFTKNSELINKGRIAMLGHSISLMADADLVVFDKDWEFSHGCCVERMVCVEYNLSVYDISNPIARMHKITKDTGDILFWR